MLPLLLCFGIVLASSLPDVPVPAKWRACTADSDCVVAGDACRSCAALISVHKNYAEAFKKKDLELRERTGTVWTCEACSTRNVRLSCASKKCVVVPSPLQ